MTGWPDHVAYALGIVAFPKTALWSSITRAIFSFRGGFHNGTDA